MILSLSATELLNDTEIISEYCENKSELAATQFVRKYQKFVYSTALRYMNSHDDADDVSQEVFIKALDNLHKFRGDSSLQTWLYRITVNLSKNALRKKKFMSLLTNDKGEEILQIADYNMPDRSMENLELEKQFRESLTKLPFKQRETFALRYFDELSYNEISEMLGTSVGGLKANYFQAVKKLANLLEDKI